MGVLAWYQPLCAGHSEEEISKDTKRPKYFNPYEAIDYGIIDRVLEPEDEGYRRVIRAQAGAS
jgi:ATP-dependent Clp protease protease subunit